MSAHCEFMQYHGPHKYRTSRGEPRDCDGLLPPPMEVHTMTDTSGAAVEALADFLLRRDWPEAWKTYRANPQRRYEYRCQAAAILAGEAWAIRKAWPEAAYEIAATRPA